MNRPHLARGGPPRLSLLLSFLCGLAAACTTAGSKGRLHRQITTDSAAAQRCFDEGLLSCYGFNHDEAIRCFEAALRDDPSCAMAWFGIAYALGPNINLPMTDMAVARRAHAAAQQAVSLSGGCTPVERDLIAAMASRYADPPPADRKALDQAFADAMRAVWHDHGGDADVGVIFADALLNLSPWDQWTKDGRPKPNTEEVLATLERVLAIAPDHVQGIHLYIHATEASPAPGRAAPFAARLGGLAPGMGHLVHMPAHTWHRMGRYQEAVAANLAGVAIDRRYFAEAGPQGVYHAYMAHNQHFAAWSAMFAGDFATALRCARELVADMPPHLLESQPQFFDGWVAVPLHVLLRFGRWQEVLAEQEPGASFPIARAMWHYARGVAQANLLAIAAARTEQQALEAATAKVPAEAGIGITPAHQVLAVAKEFLAGELCFHAGEREAAFAHLRAAAAAEDRLRYDEPYGWMMPTRHALGALLLADGRVEAAEQAYREDLQRYPHNGWSLHGLAECQRRRNDPAAAATEAAFRRAWAHADTELRASCFCRPL